MTRPKSKYVGKIVSCLTCPHEGDHHAKVFAKDHAYSFAGLGLEEVFDKDVHELVISDRATGNEVSRHDISELKHHEIQRLIVKQGIHAKGNTVHHVKTATKRAEIQLCASCGLPEDHLASRFAGAVGKGMYKGVELSKTSTARGGHDLVVFDAGGREIERTDLTKLSAAELHQSVLRHGFKLAVAERKRAPVHAAASAGSKLDAHSRRLAAAEAGFQRGTDNRARAAAAHPQGKPNVVTNSPNHKFAGIGGGPANHGTATQRARANERAHAAAAAQRK